jgi:hypothetical protein
MVRARLVSGAQDQKASRVMATSLKNGASLGHTCNIDPLSIKDRRVDTRWWCSLFLEIETAQRPCRRPSLLIDHLYSRFNNYYSLTSL